MNRGMRGETYLHEQEVDIFTVPLCSYDQKNVNLNFSGFQAPTSLSLDTSNRHRHSCMWKTHLRAEDVDGLNTCNSFHLDWSHSSGDPSF